VDIKLIIKLGFDVVIKGIKHLIGFNHVWNKRNKILNKYDSFKRYHAENEFGSNCFNAFSEPIADF
jgi:hypothetical protein